jgi:hypothetical protein
MSEQKSSEVVPAGKSEFVDEIEKTFALSDAGKALAIVSNISGTTTVTAWDKPEIFVRAVKRARSQRSFEQTSVEIVQEGDSVTARTIVNEEAILAGVMDFLRGERAGATVEYTVRAPAACAVRAKTVNGTVNLSGLANQSEANSVNGSVRIDGLNGKLVASTVNGSLAVADSAGDAELNTVNGSLEIRNGKFHELEARTVSGSLRAMLALDPGGSYSFNSTNGDCELRVPADSRCTVSMQAVNGGVECELPHKTTASEMRPAFSRWEGTINGGGAAISFRTVNGRLRLKASGETAVEARPAAPTAAQAASGQTTAPAPQPESANSTMEVLRAVERGELSVDEAMFKLKGKQG